jgi:hypothetical protein
MASAYSAHRSTTHPHLARAIERVKAAIEQDSPRSALSAARSAGAPEDLPQLVAMAAEGGAPSVARALIHHGWPAESIGSFGQNALWFAMRSKDSALAFELLKAGANPWHLGTQGTPLGAAAAQGSSEMIVALVDACLDKQSSDLARALNQALWEACGSKDPSAAQGCFALAGLGASWSHEPRKTNLVANCAQRAAAEGPMDVLEDPDARSALEKRHPPLKGRGSWTDWRALVPADRTPRVERWILLGHTNTEALACPQPSLRRRL